MTQRETISVDLAILARICSEHLIEVKSGINSVVVVSQDGLSRLKEFFSDSTHHEVGILQIAMTKDPRIDNSLKKQLLYGLLLPGGLTLIKEDKTIIAPTPEIPIDASSIPRGSIHFLEDIDPEIFIDPPDLSYICKLKRESNLYVHQLLQFILYHLTQLPPSETLLGDGTNGTFRLKSYSSAINKFFFRGKKVKDFFAATVLTNSSLETLTAELDNKGAIPWYEADILNGSGDQVYRYVRVLQVELEGRNPFTIPIFYEIAYSSFKTPVPHDQYELNRLRFSVGKGQQNYLKRMGFGIETYQS